jgi:hypothetical protein
VRAVTVPGKTSPAQLHQQKQRQKRKPLAHESLCFTGNAPRLTDLQGGVCPCKLYHTVTAPRPNTPNNGPFFTHHIHMTEDRSVKSPDDEQEFSTGDCAALVGVSTRTLREWERCGLFKARRDSIGNRLWNRSEIAALRQIKTEREIRHGRTGRRSLVIATSTSTGRG